MVVIIIFIIVVVVGAKNWVLKRDAIMEEKLKKLNESLSETQSLFNKEVKALLTEMRKSLK